MDNTGIENKLKIRLGMSRFEWYAQVVLLFVGTAIVSIVLIALLNAEANSRKIKEPEIENETLFTVLGRKLIQLAQKLSHLEQPDYIRVKRSLQSYEDSVTTAALDKKESHPVRHHGKHSRVHRNSTPATSATGPVTNKKTPPRLMAAAPHDTCYTTHEVLIIIAITCAVNFTFMFVVLAMVHMCNKHASNSCKSTGLTGLDSLDVPEECLVTGHVVIRSTSCNGVQEYINNLPLPRTTSMTSVARSVATPQLQLSYSMEDLLYVD